MGGGRRRTVCRAREGIAYLWIEAWGRSGRPLAPAFGVHPQSVYAAAQRGRASRAQWARDARRRDTDETGNAPNFARFRTYVPFSAAALAVRPALVCRAAYRGRVLPTQWRRLLDG